MEPNQTSVTRGTENILLPMEYFKCTQGDFEGNHPYYACDLAGRDAGRDLAYFPFSARCVGIDAKNGNAVWWESLKPVRFADGSIDYAVIMVIHDNNLAGIRKGVTYAQGQQMAQEGTAGFATGNHLHLEIAKGKFTSMYAKNAKGYYLPNGRAIETCCFADGTTFLNSGDWKWKYTKDIVIEKPSNSGGELNEVPSDFVHEKATFVCGVDKINIRCAPSTSGKLTGDWYEKGMSVTYDGYVKRDGYVWISWYSDRANRRHWMAIREINTNKAYGTFK